MRGRHLYGPHPQQLFLYEALGLCPEGQGGQLIDTAEWRANKSGECCELWPVG